MVHVFRGQNHFRLNPAVHAFPWVRHFFSHFRRPSECFTQRHARHQPPSQIEAKREHESVAFKLRAPPMELNSVRWSPYLSRQDQLPECAHPAVRDRVWGVGSDPPECYLVIAFLQPAKFVQLRFDAPCKSPVQYTAVPHKPEHELGIVEVPCQPLRDPEHHVVPARGFCARADERHPRSESIWCGPLRQAEREFLVGCAAGGFAEPLQIRAPEARIDQRLQPVKWRNRIKFRKASCGEPTWIAQSPDHSPDNTIPLRALKGSRHGVLDDNLLLAKHAITVRLRPDLEGLVQVTVVLVLSIEDGRYILDSPLPLRILRSPVGESSKCEVLSCRFAQLSIRGKSVHHVSHYWVADAVADKAHNEIPKQLADEARCPAFSEVREAEVTAGDHEPIEVALRGLFRQQPV